jgi:hypothetical protein
MPQPWETYQSAQPVKQPWENYGAPPSQGVLDRIGTDLNKRGDIIKQQWDAAMSGQQNPAESGVNIVGKGIAGGIADTLGEGVNAIIPQGVKNVAGRAAQSVADFIDSHDPQTSDALLGLSKAVPEVQKQYPRVSNLVDSAVNIAGVAPITAAAGEAGGKLLSSMGEESGMPINLASGGVSKITDMMRGKPAITQDMVRNVGSNAYKFVEQSGTGFTPALTDKVLGILDNGKQAPIAGKVLTSEAKDINGALSEFDDLKGSPLTITDFQKIDSNLGDKAAQAYVSGNANKGRILSQAQDQIRELVKSGNLAPADLVGPQEGVDALTQDAIPVWSTQAKMGDIQKIVDRANMMDNPSTGIKTGLRNLALNKNRMASYPPEIQKLIIKGATTGKIDDLLGVLGSRLNGIAGAAIGGIPGSIVSNLSSMAARGLRTGAKVGEAQAISDALVEGIRPQIAKYMNGVPPIPAAPQPSTASLYPNLAASPVYGPSLKNIMSMPPAQAKAALGKLKSP